MRGDYLRQCVAILCRLTDALTSRISSTPIMVSDFFLGDARILASALTFRIYVDKIYVDKTNTNLVPT